MFEPSSIVIVGLISVVFSFLASFLTFKWSKWQGIYDDPSLHPGRKSQTKPIPLMGATGFIITSLILCAVVYVYRDSSLLNVGSFLDLNDGSPQLLWILVSVGVLMFGGYWDDKYDLPAKWMFFPISLALLIAVIPGRLVISSLSSPFDSILPSWDILPQILGFAWLGFCLAATKFLDGHDGLVSSVGIIALSTIGSVSLFGNVFQPLVFTFCIIWIGGLLGFLPFNFPNAKIYLGEGGSEIVGFVIGVLAIISGAKIATASTVIGWFILDMVLVFMWRFFKDKPLLGGDKSHWHFRLMGLGLNKLQVLVLTAFILLITAHLGLVVETSQKPKILFSQVIALTVIFIVSIILSERKSNPELKTSDEGIFTKSGYGGVLIDTKETAIEQKFDEIEEIVKSDNKDLNEEDKPKITKSPHSIESNKPKSKPKHESAHTGDKSPKKKSSKKKKNKKKNKSKRA